ncbi:MAG: redoxin family protein [Bacteroidetes bacterium]|nr:redoxin family protein [Bacteroidota bacterium]
MKNKTFLKYFFSLVACFGIVNQSIAQHPSLTIGAAAPDFSLQGTGGKTYSLNSFKNAKLLVVVFTCNHCPTAQAYEKRIMRLAAGYAPKGVALVAIMPNGIDPPELKKAIVDDLYIGWYY